MADQIQRADIAQHSDYNWNPTSGAVIGSAATSGEGDGIYKWGGVVDDITKWWEKQNQAGIQDGYVDEMNAEADRSSWFNRKGYREGRALYVTTQQQAVIAATASELNRKAAMGEITEQERDTQVKALARDQQNYTLDMLEGKSKEVAMEGLINTTALNAKNYVAEKERAAWITADSTSIAVVNNHIEQLSTIVDTKDFQDALPMLFEQGRQATYAAWDKIPDGYKQARDKAEVTAIATVQNLLGKLDPTNADHILRGKLVAEAAKGMQGMSQEGRTTIDKVMEKFNTDIQGFNSMHISMEINSIEEAVARGDIVTYEKLDEVLKTIYQRTLSGDYSHKQGRQWFNKVSGIKQQLYGDERRAREAEAKATAEKVNPFTDAQEYAAATNESIDKSVTKQAQEIDKARQVQNGLQGDPAKIAMSVIGDGQLYRNYEAVALGAKRLGHVIAPMFTMTKEELAAQDNASSNSVFQAWVGKYQHAVTTNNYDMQQSMLQAIPQDYREAVITMATQGNPLLGDTRTAIPEIARTRTNLEAIKNSPAHRDFKFTTGFTDSTFFGSTGAEATLGSAPSKHNQLVNESLLQGHRDQNAKEFRNAALTDKGMVGEMIRLNFAVKLPNGGFPSVPNFHININKRGDVNAQIPDALYSLAQDMVKENNGKFRIEDTNFIISGTEVQIQLRDKDGNAFGGSSKVFTTGQVRARIDKAAADKSKTYKRPAVNTQRPTTMKPSQAEIYFKNPPKQVQTPTQRVTQATQKSPQQRMEKAPSKSPWQSTSNVQESRNAVVPQGVQQHRDQGRKGILQQELANERKGLAQAKIALTSAQLIKGKKVDTKHLQRAIDDRNQNIQALSNEISRMK